MLHGTGGLPLLLRSEEHTSELQSRLHLVCRLLLEKKTEQMQPEAGRPPRRGRPGRLPRPGPRRARLWARVPPGGARPVRQLIADYLFFFLSGAPPTMFPFFPQPAFPPA